MSLPRRAWLLGGVALAAGVGGAAWRIRGAGDSALDATFWSRRFDQPDGGTLDLAAFRGQKLMLNFWATWCPPCVEEMPMLDAFFRENSANGWHLIGLAIDQPSAVRKFLARTPVGYPIALAGTDGSAMVRSLGNSSGGLPFTVVLNQAGQIEARKVGKLSASDLAAWRGA